MITKVYVIEMLHVFLYCFNFLQSNGSTFHSHTALQVGSILLEVNNSSLVGIQHSEVAASIANAFLDETSDYMKFLITEPGWEVKIGTKWPFSRVEASQLKTEKMVWKLKIDASAAEFFLYIILYFLLVGGGVMLSQEQSATFSSFDKKAASGVYQVTNICWSFFFFMILTFIAAFWFN